MKPPYSDVKADETLGEVKALFSTERTQIAFSMSADGSATLGIVRDGQTLSCGPIIAAETADELLDLLDMPKREGGDGALFLENNHDPAF